MPRQILLIILLPIFLILTACPKTDRTVPAERISQPIRTPESTLPPESTVHGEFVDVSIASDEDLRFDGWLVTWGRGRVDSIHGIDRDSSGNLYAAGNFSRSTDFDPGTSVVTGEALGEIDCFLSKFTSDGDFLWVKIWGGPSNDAVMGIATDNSGNSYITGNFQGTADFNPATGTDNIIAKSAPSGMSGTYILALNSSGDFRWVKTLGNRNGEIRSLAITLDGGGSPLITGWFSGTIDFDPAEDGEEGAGIAQTVARSGSDAYVLKLSSNGSLRWVSSWGGDDPGLDQITGTCIASDGGSVYIGGRFQNRFELGPTSGLEINFGWHSSQGGEDAFVCKLNSEGYPQWAKTWGGTSNDYVLGITVSGSGAVYTTGGIEGKADLNPDGHNTDEHDADSSGYAFLSKLSSSGGYSWGRTWGTALGMAVATDSSGNVIVVGTARNTVDYNPDPAENAVDEQHGKVYITKFNSSGTYLWAHAWGSSPNEMASAIATDPEGNIFASGIFSGLLTYNPDSGFSYTSITVSTDAFIIRLLPDGGW